MLHLPIDERLGMCNDVHTYDAPGSIVCRALHAKRMNGHRSAMRSNYAAPRTKEP